uniref:Uncharacterized protein n=1 Tax=Anguilla anguilla TaxID=7936 RepID=A0A0E9V8P0_ANGAN
MTHPFGFSFFYIMSHYMSFCGKNCVFCKPQRIEDASG